MDLFAVIGIVLVLVLLGVLFITPSQEKKGRRRRRKKTEEEEGVDWQTAALRLERHVQSLRKEAEGRDRTVKDLERQVRVEREKYKRLQEKGQLQKSWQQKETTDVEKKDKQIRQLQKNLEITERSLEQEHTQRLRFERELKELREEIQALKEHKRSLESELAKARALSDGARQEMMELREINAKLKKQNEDTTWVSKTEYDKLKVQIRDRERELEQLKKKTE